VNAALLASLVAALVLVAIAWLGSGRVSPKQELGTLNLNFTTSFASAITVIGAILGTVVSAAGVLPSETVNFSKAGFTGLNVLFGVAIVVAGVVYAALQRPKWVESPTDARYEERQLQGTAGAYLLACVITIWAVFGQMWTLALLIDELGQGDGFTAFAVLAFKIMLLVAFVAMVIYTVRRVDAVFNAKRKKPTAEAGAVAVPEPPLDRVSLL
jgi:hypothetical protein